LVPEDPAVAARATARREWLNRPGKGKGGGGNAGGGGKATGRGKAQTYLEATTLADDLARITQKYGVSSTVMASVEQQVRTAMPERPKSPADPVRAFYDSVQALEVQDFKIQGFEDECLDIMSSLRDARNVLAQAKRDRLDLVARVEEARGAVASSGAGAAMTPTHDASNFMRLMAEFSNASPSSLDFCNQLVQFIRDQKAAAASVTGAQPSASASGDVSMTAAAPTFNFGVTPQPAQSSQLSLTQSTIMGPIATLGRGSPDMGRGRSSSQPPNRQRRSTSRSAARDGQGVTAPQNKMPQDVLAEVDAALSATAAEIVTTQAPASAPIHGAPFLDPVGGALGLSAPILGQQSG